MYVDDGIFIELSIPERLAATTERWEYIARGLLGQDALNAGKLKTEGSWEKQQIMLGFVFNLERLTISPPEGKIDGAKVLFGRFLESDRSQRIALLEMQQLRGHVEHSQSTSLVWKLAKHPSDLLLGFSDETGLLSVAPIPLYGVCSGIPWI